MVKEGSLDKDVGKSLQSEIVSGMANKSKGSLSKETNVDKLVESVARGNIGNAKVKDRRGETIEISSAGTTVPTPYKNYTLRVRVKWSKGENFPPGQLLQGDDTRFGALIVPSYDTTPKRELPGIALQNGLYVEVYDIEDPQ